MNAKRKGSRNEHRAIRILEAAGYWIRSERGQTLPPHVPESEQDEKNEEQPFEIATPDHLLDTVTDGGIDVGDCVEEIRIVVDRLRSGQHEGHMRPPVSLLYQQAWAGEGGGEGKGLAEIVQPGPLQ